MTTWRMAFGGSPGALERLIGRGDLSCDEAAAALLQSLRFETLTVAFEPPPAM
jgi:hypothetical protein